MANADVGLPHWERVLVVVAHPDDESFGLGAVLSSFVDAGADVSVLCFTQGEASTLHGVEGDLADRPTRRAGRRRCGARHLLGDAARLSRWRPGG